MRYLLPYIWYETSTGTYQHFVAEDKFAPLTQREKGIPSILPICYGGAGVDDAAGGRDAQRDRVMCDLAYVLWQKLKEVVCSNR